MWPSCVPVLLGLRCHLAIRLFLPLLALTLLLLVPVSPTFVPASAAALATQWTTFRYDALGRVTRTTYPDGTQTRACYDDWVTVEIDANRHKTRTTRDAYGRVVKVEEYTGTYTTCSTARGTPYATTTYTYDRLDNLLTVTDALGNRTTMQYDTLSRKTQMRAPDLGTWRYQYDLNGNLIRQTDAKAQQLHFQYDSLNRRVQKDYGRTKALGSGDVRYTYDGSSYHRQGRLAQVVDASGTTAFRYDAAGRVTRTDKTVDSVTYSTQNAYDGLGRVTSLTYPDNSTVTYAYTGPQLQSVRKGSTTYARYSGFNTLGQPSTLTLGNGTTTTYTYDSQNYRLKTLTTLHGSTVLQNLGYTFDSGGNVTAITDSRHGNQTFSYDALDRLTTATNGATGGYGTVTYSYNQIGNLLNNSQVGRYTYNTSGATSTRPHAVTRVGTNTYSYDANGNLSRGGGRTLTWDAENRPTRIVKGGVTTTFVYDGDGGRVKKTVQGTTTVYIGQLYVCTDTACAKLIYAGAQRVAMVQVGSGSTSYFHADRLGSTSVLTNASGTAEEHNSYEPYGDLHTHTGTSDVAYKYTGQERDASTDLYFYQARYYAQGLGRFVSPDSIVQNPLDPQAFNRYAYARNNPVRYTDPTGHWWNDWPGDDWPGDNWGGGGPGEPVYDPVTGVYRFPERVVKGTRLPPASLFRTPFGTDPWARDRFFGSDPFVTLVGSGGGVSLTDDYVDKTSIAISNKKQLYFDVVVQNHQSRIGQQLIVNLYSGSALDGPGGIITNPKLGRRTPFDVLRQRIGGSLVRFKTSLIGLQDTYLQISIYGSRADPPILTFPALGGFTPCLAGRCERLFGY